MRLFDLSFDRTKIYISCMKDAQMRSNPRKDEPGPKGSCKRDNSGPQDPRHALEIILVICTQCSLRSGSPGGPTGKLQRRLDRTGRQFLLLLVLGYFRTAGFEQGPRAPQGQTLLCRPNKGPQGRVVDYRSPDKDGGDL